MVLEEGSIEPRELRKPGAIEGGFPEAKYPTGRCLLPPGSALYVFSDGVYVLARADGTTVQAAEFVAELARPCSGPRLDAVMAWACAIRAGAGFEDDVSILELQVP